MPTQNISLSDQQAKFIRQSVDTGHYRNASEVVRAGLRLLEKQEQQEKLKLRALRRLASETFDEIDRGEFRAITADGLDAFLEELDAPSGGSRPK